MKHISFVVPVFNEEANLREFYQRLTDIMWHCHTNTILLLLTMVLKTACCDFGGIGPQ